MAEAPLANLHDLALPAAVGAWPPAPFALGLLASLLAALLWLGFRAWRRHRASAYRRRALHALQALTQACQNEPSQLAELPALLRHTALQAWPRELIVPLAGDAWLDFLVRQAPGLELPRSLAQLGYWPAQRIAALPVAEREQLLHGAAQWIRHHVRP